MDVIEPTPDLLLGRRYRLTRLLSRGGMGEVWVADDTTLGLDVAVKLLGDPGLPAFLHEAKARFDAEQNMLAQLRTPYVVQIRDRGVTEGGQPYFVMDLLNGKSLQEHLDEYGRLGVSEVLDLLEELGRAIREPHERGLVHRDLKPGNIFLLEYLGQRRLDVRLLDFGIAKSLDDGPVSEAETKPGMMLGTPLYIAPEQIEGRSVAGSDIYAIGAVAYRCLAGAPPFTGGQVTVLSKHLATQPERFDPELNVPPEVEHLILALLTKKASLRPNAAALVEAVEIVREQLNARGVEIAAGPLSPPRSQRSTSAVTPGYAKLTTRVPGAEVVQPSEVERPLGGSTDTLGRLSVPFQWRTQRRLFAALLGVVALTAAAAALALRG